ncbi:MAG: hypothetical protein HUU60_04555 [Armatimonadetes bacterium]|nr:hypothetical protein [Armatimonadota bacterium]
MSAMRPVNLAMEWRARRQRELLKIKGLFVAFVSGSALSILSLAAFALLIPDLRVEKARQETILKALIDAPEESMPPFEAADLENARARCQEFSLAVMATGKTVPLQAWLEEMQAQFEHESGWSVNLRGGAQDFEAIKAYSERLRTVGLFTEVTPSSVNRGETDGASRFEIRLIAPSQASAEETE